MSLLHLPGKLLMAYIRLVALYVLVFIRLTQFLWACVLPVMQPVLDFYREELDVEQVNVYQILRQYIQLMLKMLVATFNTVDALAVAILLPLTIKLEEVRQWFEELKRKNQPVAAAAQRQGGNVEGERPQQAAAAN